MERVYTIPLRDVKKVPRTKRSPRATRYVRDFIQRHMKSEDVKIDASVNEKIWERGIQKIPPRIKVKATKEDDGSVLVTLA
ncbi:50S ribosomal protein L31e [Methanobacterium sp. CWC-01]|jgi:large subunit ribosomal protein L31e|uniref:50S ribosomal protein L31e n=1 Tax=Methanobacterium aridiramus TaxID=2584467 RepID=UPI0025764F7B|nr:50S ribosomal protein L31e [Methanobacterium sp. CWC-01]MDI9438091.1 50S ribosomal protein L31e [Euryarchaeota archaeon]WJI09947.1 50S ribosomal protein L31e [Methanobacterium sp. CWC-01]HNR25771.1 50S ribosomal protein L31e [Methanobacteriaceae archaeon]HNS25113.1 50S ribosomal protein L31e [Methanobacteriaceae archaeon]